MRSRRSPIVPPELPQQLPDSLLAVGEDGFDILADLQRVDHSAQDAERQSVANRVIHLGTAVYGLKAVGVMPQPVRAASLGVDEAEADPSFQ